MFRGVNTLSLDAKGRLAIPSRYRDVLVAQCGGQVVVTINHAERCLWLYPLDEWEVIEQKVVSLPSLDPAAQRLKRILIGHASELTLDASGRILLMGPLREYAELDKRVVLLGQGNKFEIWNDQLWYAQREEWLAEAKQTSEGPQALELESLSL